MKIVLEEGDVIKYVQEFGIKTHGNANVLENKCSIKNVYTKLETNEISANKFFKMLVNNEKEAENIDFNVRELLGFNGERKKGKKIANIKVDSYKAGLRLMINDCPHSLEMLKSENLEEEMRKPRGDEIVCD